MENHEAVKKLQKIIVSCMFGFVAVFVIAIVSFVSLGRARHANAKYDEFIKTLETQESALKNSVTTMDTDEYLEKQARENLGMIKDGETLYIFK